MGALNQLVGGVTGAIRDFGNAIAPGSGDDLVTVAKVAAIFYAPQMVGNWAATAAFNAGVATSTVLTIGTVAQSATSLFLLSQLSGATNAAADPVGSAQAGGLLINTSSNVAPLQVVYGARRVGGTRVLVQTSGATNEYLHLVLALAEGTISAVPAIYIDDTLITDAKFTGLVESYVHLGTDGQAADSTLVSRLPAQWTAAHKGSGVAYVYLQLKYSQTAFRGFPTITADVDGLVVYDPRTTTTAYSTNPALCIRDYLTNTRYGRGIAAALIDDASFIVAANYCDATVSTPAGTAARYTCNGVVNVDATPLDNLKGLLSSCRGMLIYSGGKYKLVLDAVGSSSFTFTEDNITGNWSIATSGRASRYNRVTASFFNPASNWQPDYAISDSTSYRAMVDNGLLLEASLDLPFTTNAYTSAQLAGLQLKQSRFGLVCSFTAFQNAVLCEVGDVVSITHSTPGWSARLFRVNQLTLRDDDEVEVVCTEYDTTVYDLDTLTAITSTPALSLPDPFSVATPAGVSLSSGTAELLIAGDGTIVSRIKVAWTVPTDIFSSTAEVQYKQAIESIWQAAAPADAFAGSAWASPVRDGVVYDVRVRFVNKLGVPSAWVASTHAVVGKTAPPATFDFFNILVQPDGTRQYNFGYNSLAARPADWLGAEIRYTAGTVATPDWAAMTPLQDATTYYTSSPVELNAPLAGAYTFACKSLDTTGNESTYLVRSITLPDRRLGNVFDEFFEGPDGWLGTKTGCHIQDGVLEANDTTTWATLPATWAGWTRWNWTPTSPIQYETPARDFGTIVAGQLNPTIVADGTVLVELATSMDGTTWSAYGSGSAAFSTRWLKVRVTVTATVPVPVPMLRQFDYQINAPIKSEYINDVVISALTGAYRIGVGDIRIPLEGTYSLLKRANPTIQDSTAGTWSSTRIDNSLSPSPRWQFRLNGVLADPAFVDFFIEGF